MNHPHSEPASFLNTGFAWSRYIVLAGALGGCSNLPNLSTSSVHPQRNLQELLAQRLELCGMEKALRAEQIRQLRSQLQRPHTDDEPTVEHELTGLMLLSCEPANSPGLQGEVLNHLISQGQWPSDYTALFDLLRSEQRAISQYNSRIQDSARENAEMRQTLQTQKDELTKLQGTYKAAIKGIGEIEETLDSRTPKPPPTP